MLELLLCSLLTILPDYLYRRFGQGKRLGKEITLFSVWFELRWGIITCLMLTIGLITVIFYNHPSTTSATVFFRSVPIISETNGRVAQVHVPTSGKVAQGAPIFTLDSTGQQAAVETARRKLAEVDAALLVAKADILTYDGKIQEAKSALQQALDPLQVEPVGLKLGDQPQPRDVLVPVIADPLAHLRRLQQAARLMRADVAHAHP